MKTTQIYFLTNFIWFVLTNISLAEIIPDNTLPNSSRVETENNIHLIQGGTQSRENLFHSFEKFSLPTGNEILFNNAVEIKNIINRVTGNDISFIDGFIRANGNANVFFLNPNGIVFGENAVVDVGGSFIATTANTIKFSDGQNFTSDRIVREPILIWNAPIGLGLNENSGQIVIRGRGHNLLLTPERLIVNDDNLPLVSTKIFTENGFALIGNEVIFEGGVLDIESKNIEIGSVIKGNINFSLSPTWQFDYSEVEQLNNINLDNFSLLNINGDLGIVTNFIGNSIKVDRGSFVFSIKRNELNENQQQTINFNAKQNLLIKGLESQNPPSIDGLSRGISAIASQNFTGTAIDINIVTQNLSLESGGGLGTLTLQDGLSGNMNINANNFIKISGSVPSNPTLGFSSIGSSSVDSANSSSISIKTNDLLITDGAVISTSSLNLGKTGNIKIEAQDSLIINGVSNSSNLAIPSIISTTAFGTGNSGSIDIQTTDLSILNGGAISTSSFSNTVAGNIKIKANNSLTVDGFSDIEVLDGIDTFNSTITSSVASSLNPELINTNPNFQTLPVSTGLSGNIFLDTNNLTISNNGTLSVRNDNFGNSGNLEINANSITLENTANINASSFSGRGGNIVIDGERLQLFDNSKITTNSQGDGDGGNITINTDRLLAQNNSDITANAFLGNGGNVNIKTDIILGIQPRDKLTNFSDITADSNLGFDGNINLDSPETQFQEDSTIFSQEIFSNQKEQLVSKSCLDPNRSRNNLSLIDSGIRIVQSPYNFFDDVDLDLSSIFPSESNWIPGKPIREGNSIVLTKKGEVFLVTQDELNASKLSFCHSK